MKKTEIENQGRRIEKYMRTLITDINELSNMPEDESAYHIIYDIRELHHAIEAAEKAGSNETGSDGANIYEYVADAIRRAKR